MPWKAKTFAVREAYESALNLKLGGDDVDEGPEIIKSSFTVRRKKSE